MPVVRAPGRVNLIGEHTDYNGLPVLPMALDREIVLRYQARRDRRVVLTNADPRFPPQDFTLGADIPPEPAGAWGNYVRAAAQALWRETGPLAGIEGEVSSTLPTAAGLSSSSALVVASALALLDAAARDVPRPALMEMLARGERYVGLEGGGMDQAISLGGLAGHAMRIDFRPVLRLTPVPVPPGWRFIIAPSGVEAAKSAGARDAYNLRVRECRAALAAVAGHGLGVAPPADYRELLDRVPAPEALAVAEGLLEDTLLRRFRHVVTEAVRVDEAERALHDEDLERFGTLLDASHASLRDDFQVSIPALDELVVIAREGGAAGARLTGAGLGGCIVAVAEASRVEGVIEALADRFYRPRGGGETAFVARPSDGAKVLR